MSSAILLALSSECTQKRMYSSLVVPSRDGALRGRVAHLSCGQLKTLLAKSVSTMHGWVPLMSYKMGDGLTRKSRCTEGLAFTGAWSAL